VAAARTCLRAVRSEERCALLRIVRERAWRIAFFADLIFGMARKVDGKLRGVKRIHIFGRHLPRAFAISFEFLLWAPVLLFSMVAHEYAHAEAAYRQGDSTAYMLGRLTFNPLKHIDPFMTVILPLMTWFMWGYAFGGAKPVPVNPRNYRNYVRGDIIVSLAGIAVNLVLFVIFTALVATVGTIAEALPSLTPTLEILQRMMAWGVWLNLVLAFFNLIPIPPLDGSHVFYHLLPPNAGMQYRELQRFGFIPIVLVSYLVPGVIRFFLWPAFQLLDVVKGVVLPVALPNGLPSVFGLQ
jgi:Zn-dependent protease